MGDDGALPSGETRLDLNAALDGDGSARARLLERLRPRIVLWVSTRLSKKLREQSDPEDLAQEVLLAIHKDLDNFEDRGLKSFYAWMFRIAENRIRDFADYSSAKKRTPRPPIAVSQTTPSTAAMRSESFDRVHGAIERLGEDHRLVIQLRRLEERETSEVAEIMGRSENAVRILYCRALKALREEMGAAAEFD